MKNKINLILRIFLGSIFVYASIDKISNPELFAKTVYHYQILPDFMINAAALILPFIELICGLFLIAGVWIEGSLFIIDCLLIIFMAVLIFNISRGLNIHCGCFSTTSKSTTDSYIMILTVLRDIVFILIGAYLFIQMCLKKIKEE